MVPNTEDVMLFVRIIVEDRIFITQPVLSTELRIRYIMFTIKWLRRSIVEITRRVGRFIVDSSGEEREVYIDCDVNDIHMFDEFNSRI